MVADRQNLLELLDKLADRKPWPSDHARRLWLASRSLRAYRDSLAAGELMTIDSCDLADLNRYGRRAGGWWATREEFVGLADWERRLLEGRA